MYFEEDVAAISCSSSTCIQTVLFICKVRVVIGIKDINDGGCSCSDYSRIVAGSSGIEWSYHNAEV